MDPSPSSPEVEAKLALPGPVYWRLRDDPDLLGLSVVTTALERQSNLFYDTADHALRGAGAVLRARKLAGQPGVEWTLKAGRLLVAGIQTADEIVEWGPDADDPLAAAESLSVVAAARRLGSVSLLLDAASLADRLLLAVAAPSGGQIGVSLDRLRIPGDPVFVDYELEAEAHGAARSDVEALAADLTARFGLEPSTDSKRARIQRHADGRLGPRRVREPALPTQVADVARRHANGSSVHVHVGGLTGSPTWRVAQDVERELTGVGVACQVSCEPEDSPRADLRLWVASSVHWRLLRYLAPRAGNAASAVDDFRQQTERVDRRTLEWRWREADLVVLADEPSVFAEQEPTSSEGTIYPPDDLPLEVGGEIWLRTVGDGSQLTFAAHAWPADLASFQHTFVLAAPAERVAEALTEIGFEG